MTPTTKDLLKYYQDNNYDSEYINKSLSAMSKELGISVRGLLS